MGNNLSVIGVNPCLYWNPHDQFNDTRDEQMESIEDERDRATIKHNRETGAKIRRLIREDQPREQIFLQMCQELELLEIGLGKATDYFRLADEDITLLHDLLEDYYELVLKILEEVGKCQNLIAIWTEVDDSYQFLNARYGIRTNAFSIKQTRLTLSDNFHGQERPIHIDCPFADISLVEQCHLGIVDFEYLLFVDINTSRFFDIYLARFDFPNSKCNFLMGQKIEENFSEILIDPTNRRNFLVISLTPDNRRYFRLGRIEKERIVFQKSAIRFGDPRLFCTRFVGDRVQALLLNEDEYAEEWDGKVEFGEFVLVPGQDFPRFQRLFDIQMDKKLERLQEHQCYWVGNICYLAGYLHEQGVVAILDLDSRTLTATVHSFYSDGLLTDVHADEDGAVSLCVWNGPDDVREIHRFCLKEPETLFNSILLKLRRDAIFYDGDFYDQLLAYLPPYLQPMAILNLSAWPSNSDVPILVPNIPSRSFLFAKFLILTVSKK